ncbi:hypothetical protein OTU49_015453, partial [Cherax quadricarinatus]
MLAVLWAVLCCVAVSEGVSRKVEEVPLARSSDPNVQHGDTGQILLDPSNLLDLPLGSPDTMETDIPGPPLSPTDFENSAGMIHDTVDINSQSDPIELAGLFEGDIMLNDRDALLDLPP